jgi:CRISPR-associated protein Csy1
MLDPAIVAFFSERKEEWLKRKFKPGATEVEINETEKKCEEEFSLENWLPEAASRISSRAISTHPSKFSHTSTGVGGKNKKNFTYVTPVIYQGTRNKDGYLKSGSIDNLPRDSLGNAAELDVEEFLYLELSDGSTIIDHLMRDSETARSILTIKSESYEVLKNSFLTLIRSASEAITSSKIKQVYFPVDNGYHQLSILSNSGMIFELRNRIDALRFSDTVKEGRELRRNNVFSESGYGEIYSIATIGYGGTKPQNVSVLNNQYSGKAHLLLSVPPMLEQREVKFPTKDFFIQNLSYYDCKDTLERLDNVFKIERDSQIPLDKIRKGRDRCLGDILDVILQKMMSLREASIDQFWPKTSSLPAWQKVWLCEQHKEQRFEQDDWLNVLCEQITHWINSAYKKSVRYPVMLGEAERHYIKEYIGDNKEALR